MLTTQAAVGQMPPARGQAAFLQGDLKVWIGSASSLPDQAKSTEESSHVPINITFSFCPTYTPHTIDTSALTPDSLFNQYTVARRIRISFAT